MFAWDQMSRCVRHVHMQVSFRALYSQYTCHWNRGSGMSHEHTASEFIDAYAKNSIIIPCAMGEPDGSHANHLIGELEPCCERLCGAVAVSTSELAQLYRCEHTVFYSSPASPNCLTRCQSNDRHIDTVARDRYRSSSGGRCRKSSK